MNSSAIRTLLEPTRGERAFLEKLRADVAEDDHHGLVHTLARVVWSRLIEPGDRIAVQLIALLGAEASLAHVIEHSDAQTVLHSLREFGETVPSVKEITRAFQRWRPRLDRESTLRDLQTATQTGMQIVLPQDSQWPERLNDLGAHRPLMLWLRGNPELLRTPAISIVGARACSPYGSQVTAEIAEGVVHRGHTVVSGAAYGVDGVAHRAALASGGNTIAILAGGADRLYPREHGQLLHNIIEAGLVMSEPAPGTSPTRWRFLQRNRLIAALAKATIVTEAGIRSGTINTAGHAAELGRELVVVPGPITSPGSHGCFRIIEEYGATMLTRISDLDGICGTQTPTLFDEATPERPLSRHRRVLDALPLRGSRTVPEVARLSGLTHEDSLLALTELELLGNTARTSDQHPAEARWKLISSD